MITDLEKLLNQDQLLKLVEAINKNQEYFYSENGLTVEANSTDDSLSLLISYDRQEEENYLADKEASSFQSYLETLDDDLFVDVCEYLGKEEVHKIQECLESGSLETVRSGVVKFKMALTSVVKKQIEYLNSLLYV